MSIYVFDSQQSGAPVVNENAGTVLDMIRAVLIDGVQPTYLPTTITASGSVATITFNGNHDLLVDQRVRIGGSTTVGYNGDWPVTQIVTPQSVRVQLPAAPVANVAAGPITVKRAPIPGWTMPFTGANKAAFQGPNGRWLRIDDSNSRYTSARRFDAMTSVDAGTGMWPRTDQAGNCFFNRTSFGYGPLRRWAVLSNGPLVYLAMTQSPNSNPWCHRVYLFGTVPSLLPGDPDLDLIAADGEEGASGQPILSQLASDSNFFYGYIVSRTGVGGGLPVAHFCDAAYAGYAQRAAQNPDVSNSIIGGNVLVRKALLTYPPFGEARQVRALLPHYAGLFKDTTTPSGTIRDDVAGFEGRRFYVLKGYAYSDVEGETLWFPLDVWE